MPLESLDVGRIHLVTMPEAKANPVRAAVELADLTPRCQYDVIPTQSHVPAKPFELLLLRQDVDDGLGAVRLDLRTVGVFEPGDVSGERLGCWQTKYAAGVDLFRKLVYAFYTPGFSFGGFLREHPQYRSNLVDILIGDVFKPGVGEIFDAMGEVVPPGDDQIASNQM